MAFVAADRKSAMTDASFHLERSIDRALADIGDWLMRHQTAIRRVQWVVVVAYVVLLGLPAVLPLPTRAAHIWNDLTLFAQFVFWGLWWPFVLLSMVLVGRAWCGLLCPEGALSEAVSTHGRGRAVPRWIQWKGWPFVAFAMTTIYGQMTSVYQYPRPALVVLGLLSKLAPLHFRVDPEAWQAWKKPSDAHSKALNCAPLVPIPTMRGTSLCHMCGRCSGFRGAVTLSRRSPNAEIVNVAGDRTKPWDTVLIVFGLMGVAAGAFHWGSSALYVAVRQSLAEWLVGMDITWPLEPILPWFILTNYPAQNDMMTPLDGVVLVGYIVATALIIGVAVVACLAAVARICGPWSWPRFHHFAQALIPVAACGVFLGLSSLTVTMLKAEGLTFWFVGFLRAALLLGSGAWSLWLGWRISGVYRKDIASRAVAMAPMALAVAIGCYSWATLFWKI
jgi:polyferredoxin